MRWEANKDSFMYQKAKEEEFQGEWLINFVKYKWDTGRDEDRADLQIGSHGYCWYLL